MSNEHILIVEDTALVMILLRSRLTADGYEVTGASKVAEALHAMRTRMPDLVVLDLTLFDDDPTGLTDGFAVLSLLRLRYPEADTAVIIYSANTKPRWKCGPRPWACLRSSTKMTGRFLFSPPFAPPWTNAKLDRAGCRHRPHRPSHPR